MSVRSNASKRTNKQDVEQLLSDLDSLAVEPVKKQPSSSSSSSAAAPAAPTDAQSLLDDLDNLVSDKHRRVTPKPEAQQAQSNAASPSSDARRAGSTSTPAASTSSIPAAATAAAPAAEAPSAEASVNQGTSAGGGWGSWGSVWTSATRLADQARAEIEKRAALAAADGDASGDAAKEKEKGDGAVVDGPGGSAQVQQIQSEIAKRGWALAQGFRSIVAEGGLEKLGGDLTAASRRHLTDIMNAVAPPISAHEVLQVTLSHDLVGYDGVSDVVFRVLAAAMETHQPQAGVDGEGSTEQQLVVNKAPDKESRGSRPKEAERGQERDLNAVEGFEEAYKLAEANLDELIKAHEGADKGSSSSSTTTTAPPSSNSLTIPVTTCPLFLRIQPCLAPPPWASKTLPATAEQQLFFLVLLRDPSHRLSHSTISQALPSKWMDIPFDSNAWVEQALVDVLQGALSTVGQAYVWERQAVRSGRGQGEVTEEGSGAGAEGTQDKAA